MAPMSIRVLVLAALVQGSTAATTGVRTRNSANPIRKVVTMLQMMQKKIVAEGLHEKELFEKFMCYCKTGTGTLEKSVADAEAKAPELASEIEEAEAKKKQLEADVEQHKADKSAAKSAMKEATVIREKEAAAFAAESAEKKANIAAIVKAVAALEKGMINPRGSLEGAPEAAEQFMGKNEYGIDRVGEGKYAAFLQTSAADVLRRLAMSDQISGVDRDTLTSFLTADQGEGEEYAPASGEVVGILKQMKDTMEKDLADLIATEEGAIETYKQLMAAKKKEVDELTQMIETKLTRIGELGVEIVNMKEDLDDTLKSLAEDKKFLADLKKNCATKEEDWAARSKTRSEEILALSDTIKILNDDDALDLFKKVLPSPSLLQMAVGTKEVRSQALSALHSSRGRDPRLDLISLAIRGKKVSFEKVIAMIDEMVVLLGKEQAADDEKKAYCEAEIDKAEDTLKELEHAIADLTSAIEDAESTLATVTEEIGALVQGIKDLDTQVAAATETRKQENEEYVEDLAANNAAKELIGIAKNRMNKFYNPKLYKAPPKRELSEADRISVNMGGTAPPTAMPGGIAGTGVTVLSQAAPPPPPETYGAYQTKGEESSGVISMMDLLLKDLSKQITEMEMEEKLAQEDYEKFMADSAEKRANDAKSVEDKMAAKADLETDLQQKTEAKKAKVTESMATMEQIKGLHLECDWLASNYAIRKEARADEVDALKKAKAVLSGADYSLVQTSSHRFLRVGR